MVQRTSFPSSGGTYTISSSTGAVTTSFWVNDSKVYDGWLWLYDSSGNYLGYSTVDFVDPKTGNPSSVMSGGHFYTNGATDTATIPSSDFSLVSGASVSQIAAVRVILSDGAQYGLQSSGNVAFDCRSVSAKQALTSVP